MKNDQEYYFRLVNSFTYITHKYHREIEEFTG